MNTQKVRSALPPEHWCIPGGVPDSAVRDVLSKSAHLEKSPHLHRYKFTTFDEDGEWEEFLVLPGKLIQLAEEAGLQLHRLPRRIPSLP